MLLLFDSVGIVGFKQFIVDNDKNIIGKMLFSLEKFNKKDAKTNLVSLAFPIESYEKVKERSLENLINTAKHFFHLVSGFLKLKKQKKEMKIILLDDNFNSLHQTCVEYFSYIFIRICLILFEAAK